VRDLYGKKGNDVVKSSDKGASWTKVVTITGGFNDLAYDHVRNIVYVVSEDKLKKFQNGVVSEITNLPKDQYGSQRVMTVAVDPVDPAARLLLDPALLARFPDGYRHLAYLQTRIGYAVKADMPGLKGPEVEALYARGARWLGGGPSD